MNRTDIGQALAAAIGADKVATGVAVLDARRFDQWAVKHLRDFLGQTIERPGWVARPTGVADVQAILRLAVEHRVPLIPYGLGSGVCGGIEPGPDSILIDMGAMNATREIDVDNALATFEAGKNGLEAEKEVASRGLTIGHWPQSVAISSVGGWVSTRASGQFSTAYGAIEDIVFSIEAVLPTGEVVTLGKAPRAAAGPDLRHVLMGAEGTLGVVTAVTLSLRRQPEKRAYSTWHVADMAAGFALQKAIVDADWRPPVMRQYDAREVRRLFAGHERGDAALLIMVHEGPVGRVEAELAAIGRIALDLGCEAGAAEAAERWMGARNHVPSWTSLIERNIIADTIEISARWTDIGPLYADAVASLGEIPGLLNASAHSSHVYRSGINLYFSFAVRRDDPTELESAYFEAWRKVMEATARHGGGVAHHHGIGRVRRQWLERDLGAGGLALLRRIKAAVDPAGVMNPGALIPDA